MKPENITENGRISMQWKSTGRGQYTDSRRTGQWKFYNTAGKVEQTVPLTMAGLMDYGTGITKMAIF